MDRNMLTRIGSIVSLPLAGLLVLFFFLPWLNLTCQGNAIASASGLQLATGDLTLTEQMEQVQEMSNQPQAKAKPEDPGEDVDARPWFWLGLLLPIGAGIVGLLGTMGNMDADRAGRALIVLGVIGAIVVILAATTVDYTDAAMKDAKKEDSQEAESPFGAQMQEQMEANMKEVLKTETTGILWGSLVVYLLVVGCGVVNHVMLKQAAAPSPAASRAGEPYIPPAGPAETGPPEQGPPPQT